MWCNPHCLPTVLPLACLFLDNSEPERELGLIIEGAIVLCMRFWDKNFKTWLSCVNASSFFLQLFPRGSILPNFHLFEGSRIREGKLKTLWPNSALKLSTMSYFSLPCFWDHTFNVSRIGEWGPMSWRHRGLMLLCERRCGFACLNLTGGSYLSHEAWAVWPQEEET